MTKSDDMLIKEGLTRGQAKIYLEQQGVQKQKLQRMTDDMLCVAFDALKRREQNNTGVN